MVKPKWLTYRSILKDALSLSWKSRLGSGQRHTRSCLAEEKKQSKGIDIPYWKERQTECIILTTRNKYSRIFWHFTVLLKELQIAPGFKASMETVFSASDKKIPWSAGSCSRVTPPLSHFLFNIHMLHCTFLCLTKLIKKTRVICCYK